MPRENFAAGDDAEIARIESADFHKLFIATKDADKILYRDLRKALRDAAEPMVADVKQQIGQIPSSGKYRTGVRAALQAGTRASISTSERRAGVRIVTSPRRLPPNKRVMAKALNKEKFRHPVFADPARPRSLRSRAVNAMNRIRVKLGKEPVKSWEWVEQEGRPYFGKVITSHKDDVRDRVQQVLIDYTELLRKATNG